MATEYKLSYTASQIDEKLGKINSLATKSSVEILAEEKANKSGLTLGTYTDGLVYLFIDGAPHGNGLDIKTDVVQGDVFGYVDENNIVVLNGNLADGTYTLKYEMENGNVIDIGNLVLDNNVYYSITKNLTNCIISNTASEVAKGNSYSATITANSGYELKSIVVTMGDTAVSVTNGVINITKVTGNIVITAVAEASGPVNVLPLAINADGTPFVGTNGEKGYKTGVRMSGSSGNESTQSGCMASGFIAVKEGEAAVIENITLNANDNYNVVVLYDANFAKVINTTLNGGVILKPSTGVYKVKPKSFTGSESIRYMRFSCATISENTIVTIQAE